MKKKFIFEELVDPSSLTLNNLDMSAIKNIKTDNKLLTDINETAGKLITKVTINKSTGNSVEITNFVYNAPQYNLVVINVKDDLTLKTDSDYNRVKYLTDDLKKKGYTVNWSIGTNITITKTDDKVTKPEIEKVNNQPTDFSNAQSILTSVLSPSISALNLLKNKKSTKNESMVKEEINRIKQLMK